MIARFLPMPTALRDSLLVVSGALLLTILFTWPMAARFNRAGRVDSGDARHGVWNVAWVARALVTDPSNLYNANIFHPHTNTLAFSEPNILSGLIAVPAWLVTGNAMATFNWAVLWSFLLSALAMFQLVRYLTCHRAAAAVSAILFAFCPYVFSHLGHIQLLMTFGMPLSLLAMHRFVEAPDVGRSLWLGVALAVQGLACGYYGIFGGLAVGLGLVWFSAAGGHVRDWRFWAQTALAVLVAGALIYPFLAPVLSIRDAGFGRTLDDARLFSAGWRDYLASPMLVDRWMLPLIGRWGEVLFPGFVGLGLASVALVQLFRARAVSSTGPARSVIAFYALLAAVAMWGSFGPDAGLYRVMHDGLPFFSLIRAPSRFGIVVTLAVAVLAGIGLATLARRAPRARRVVLVGAMLTLALARSTAGSLSLVDRPEPGVAYQRLAQLPAGPVVEFPYFADRFDRHRHTEYMLASTRHWKPLVNGYSDHTPSDVIAEAPVLATFPSAEAWDVLRRHGTRYVVMHWDLYQPGETPHVAVRALVGGNLRTIVEGPSASLFEITGWP